VKPSQNYSVLNSEVVTRWDCCTHLNRSWNKRTIYRFCDTESGGEPWQSLEYLYQEIIRPSSHSVQFNRRAVHQKSAEATPTSFRIHHCALNTSTTTSVPEAKIIKARLVRSVPLQPAVTRHHTLDRTSLPIFLVKLLSCSRKLASRSQEFYTSEVLQKIRSLGATVHSLNLTIFPPSSSPFPSASKYTFPETL
jgi:hypothetical protein